MPSFGDAYYVVIHPDDPDVMISESQGGNIMRTDLRTRQQTDISPQPKRNDGGPAGGPALPLQLEHADRGLAARRPRPSTSRATWCSAAATSATPGRRSAPTSRRTTSRSRRTRAARCGRRTPPPSTTARSSASPSRPRRRACCGPAPTTATCSFLATTDTSWTNVVANLPGVPAVLPRLARRAVAHGSRHGLGGLRPPHVRRPGAARVQDDRLRQDLDAPHGGPAAAGLRVGGAPGPEEPAAAVGRHRARALRLARRGQELAPAPAQEPADRAGARHPGPPARQRPHPRHPRPRALRVRRRDAAAAAGIRARRCGRSSSTCGPRCASRRASRATASATRSSKAPNPPAGALITYALPEKMAPGRRSRGPRVPTAKAEKKPERVKLEILDATGKVIRS